MIDRDQLERLVERGYIKGELASKALQVAETLVLSPPPDA